jgi:hypothetical protein
VCPTVSSEPWGVRLVDVNLALGNLVDLVRAQSTAYRVASG